MNSFEEIQEQGVRDAIAVSKRCESSFDCERDPQDVLNRNRGYGKDSGLGISMESVTPYRRWRTSGFSRESAGGDEPRGTRAVGRISPQPKQPRGERVLPCQAATGPIHDRVNPV